jgi:methyltransferase
MPEFGTSATLGTAVLAFVSLQRLGELFYARRNEARLRARGAREYAPAHYALIVAVHAAWLLGLWVLAAGAAPNLVWLLAFAGLQVLRVWVFVTLKERWTTRILVLPGAPLVRTGPYRFMSHPNYAIVSGELFVLPMAFALYAYALVFSLLNAGVLTIRIRAETRALAAERGYGDKDQALSAGRGHR